MSSSEGVAKPSHPRPNHYASRSRCGWSVAKVSVSFACLPVLTLGLFGLETFNSSPSNSLVRAFVEQRPPDCHSACLLSLPFFSSSHPPPTSTTLRLLSLSPYHRIEHCISSGFFHTDTRESHSRPKVLIQSLHRRLQSPGAQPSPKPPPPKTNQYNGRQIPTTPIPTQRVCQQLGLHVTAAPGTNDVRRPEPAAKLRCQPRILPRTRAASVRSSPGRLLPTAATAHVRRGEEGRQWAGHLCRSLRRSRLLLLFGLLVLS